jgi:hypothetical protein
MLYIKLRFYFFSWCIAPLIEKELLPRRVRLYLALWGLEVTMKTAIWKIKKVMGKIK